MKSHCDISGLPDLDEIKGELKNIDSHVFQSRSSSVGGPQLEINCSVDHKRDKPYIVLDKLYSAMDKPYNTSTIDDVKRYSIVHKPSYNVDKQLYSRDNRPYSVSNKLYSAMDKPYNTSTIDDVKRYSIVHKPSYNVDKQLYSRDNRPYSVSNKLYSVENEPYSIQNAACRPNSSRPFSPQTFSFAQCNETPQDNKTPQIKETNVVAFLRCLEGCTEYEGEYQKVRPQTWR